MALVSAEVLVGFAAGVPVGILLARAAHEWRYLRRDRVLEPLRDAERAWEQEWEGP